MAQTTTKSQPSFSLIKLFSSVSFKTSLLVLIGYSLILNIVSIKKIISFNATSKQFTAKVNQDINQIIPDNLEIKIINGQVSTNLTEPFYLVTSSAELQKIAGLSQAWLGVNVRLLTIDTNGKAEDFYRHQSLALLTKDSLVVGQQNGTKIHSLRNISNLNINKQFIQRWFSLLYRVQNVFPLLLFIVAVFYLLFQAILVLLYLTVQSLFYWLVSYLFQLPIKFRQIFAFTVLLNLPNIIIRATSQFFPDSVVIALAVYLFAFITFTAGYFGLKQFKTRSQA